MFGIGFGELVIILLIALIVVGPERMPDLARRVGKTINDLRRMYDNMRSDLGPDFDEVERAIRTLRSLDPRRELDSAGRKLIMDLARDVGPEAETLMKSSPTEIKDSMAKSLLSGTTQTTNGTTPALGQTTDDAPAASIPEPIVGDDYIAEPTQVVPSIMSAPEATGEPPQPSPATADAPTPPTASSSIGTVQIAPPAAPTVSRSRTYDIPQPVASTTTTNGAAHDVPADTTVLNTTSREESGAAA